MATIIKCFVQSEAHISNVPNEVSAVGELSSHASTFATEKQYYTSAASDGQHLTVFYAQKDDVAFVPTQAHADKILGIAKDIEDNFDGLTPAVDFLQTNQPSLTNVVAGKAVLHRSTMLLASLDFTYDDSGEPTRVIFWTSDQEFRDDYDQHEIKIIPPMQPITALYASYAMAQEALNQQNPITTSNQEEGIRAENPFTHRKVFELKWNDPSDYGKIISTYWVVLGYGPDSIRVDNILEAIRTYLLDNTIYTILQWKEYFPDIITTENFTFLPFWGKTALSVGGGSIDAVYSPVMKVSNQGFDAVRFLPTLTPSEIDDRAETVPQVWNGLTSLVVPGTGNPPERATFSLTYPKYCLLGVNDQNANRLGAQTLSVIQAMERLAIVAKDYSPGDALPASMTLIQNDNINFLEETVDGTAIRYLTRQSWAVLN